MGDEAKKIWLKYLSWIMLDETDMVYRGHSSTKYKLIPSVGRIDYTFEKELQIFEHYRNQGRKYTQCNTTLEWLASAQHHGLPTRLLDWTYNPLVALFFCVKDDPDNDGIILRTKVTKFLSDEENPFLTDVTGFYLPPLIDDRIQSQRSIFSIHGQPNREYVIALNRLFPKEHITWNKNKKEDENSFVIDAKNKNMILTYLNHVDIHFESIFGGADGLAQKLKYYVSQDIIPLINYNITKENLIYRKEELENKLIKELSKKKSNILFSKFDNNDLIFSDIEISICDLIRKNENDDTLLFQVDVDSYFTYKYSFNKNHDHMLWLIAKEEYLIKQPFCL